MVPAFTNLCNKMRDMWKDEIKNSQNDKHGAKIDVANYFSKLSLDAIGLVGMYIYTK